MGGSGRGGGGGWFPSSPRDLQAEIRQAELELADAAVSVAASVAASVAKSVMAAALSLLKAKALRLATWMLLVSFARLSSSLP